MKRRQGRRLFDKYSSFVESPNDSMILHLATPEPDVYFDSSRNYHLFLFFLDILVEHGQ